MSDVPSRTDRPDAVAEPSTTTSRISRRSFGRGVLLGATGAAAAVAVGAPTQALAAPGSTKWQLGGNGNVNNDGSNYLGTKNDAPLIFKTAGDERGRFTAGGQLGVGTSTPTARVHGRSSTTPAIRGDNTSTAASVRGVFGQITSTTSGSGAAGVAGLNSGLNATGYGVLGQHAGGGYGVYGSSNTGFGLTGIGGSRGLHTVGTSYGTTSYGTGVASDGVYAAAPNTFDDLDSYGVRAVGTRGVMGTGTYMGVVGSSDSYGVFGYTTPDTQGTGVYGRGAWGVHGRSYDGAAVFGDTNTGFGIHGMSYNDSSSTAGVYGEAVGVNANGVIGDADNGSAAYGVWGRSTSGYGIVASGNALVTGTLSKGGGSFQIDHPLDPANKYLFHSFVESPDMMNVYNGNVTTDASGDATVELPGYFEALNRDFRYQLTVVGQFAQAIVAKKVAGNRFEIKTDKPSVEVSWQVTGIRQDAFANANRIPTEVEKDGTERGKYLHPAAHGKPASEDVQYDRVQALEARRVTRVPDPEIPNAKPAPSSAPETEPAVRTPEA